MTDFSDHILMGTAAVSGHCLGKICWHVFRTQSLGAVATKESRVRTWPSWNSKQVKEREREKKN